MVALRVLCDEVLNPQGVYGCCSSGVTQVIAEMCTDPDLMVILIYLLQMIYNSKGYFIDKNFSITSNCASSS